VDKRHFNFEKNFLEIKIFAMISFWCYMSTQVDHGRTLRYKILKEEHIQKRSTSIKYWGINENGQEI
jgi:hypothetical protein